MKEVMGHGSGGKKGGGGRGKSKEEFSPRLPCSMHGSLACGILPWLDCHTMSFKTSSLQPG